uniref:TRAF-type zinc finger domain-containing protein 1 n=1 Tax=Leptobrachium leishanense TaxID=445787 RepID=A0A8C5MLN1_9ANUR
ISDLTPAGNFLFLSSKRDIPFINFTIHEIHCKRNISVCKLCKEPFPTSDMEEHLDTEHAPVTCKCKMTIEKRDLEEHELSACSLRLVKCVFCELELAFNKLGEHVDYCGARTECCEKCGRSVMKKDLVDHPEVCAPKKPPRVHSVVSSDLDTDGAWFEWNVRNSFMDPMLPRRFYKNSSRHTLGLLSKNKNFILSVYKCLHLV